MAESVVLRKCTRSNSSPGKDEGNDSKKRKTVRFSVS